ncbi:MAG TPA: hypothetical protein VFI46_13875, partial [Jiangellaceae bacterium]|nr:hypothetical protein [Jiangellaceae bacterium]
MAGHDSYPPPGAAGPAPPPGQTQAPQTQSVAGWPAPLPGGAPALHNGPPPPGMLGAAHKPGAIPLRPLNLGDMYDAAFRIIRFNPKATVGSAVLVAAVAMAIPVLVTSLLTWTVGLSLDEADGAASGPETAGVIGSFASLGLGTILQSIGLILVTGMIAHVTAAAAVGRRLSEPSA